MREVILLVLQPTEQNKIGGNIQNQVVENMSGVYIP